MSHLLQSHELSLPAFDLASLLLLCGFDDGDDLVEKALAKILLVGIFGFLERGDEVLVVGQSDGNAFPLVATECIHISASGCTLHRAVGLGRLWFRDFLLFDFRSFRLLNLSPLARSFFSSSSLSLKTV